MPDGYIVVGAKVKLRKTRISDLSHYKRWNNPELRAWSYDAPWLSGDLTAVINWRKKWLQEGGKKPYRFLEIEYSDGHHVGWVVVYHDAKDPHMTEIGIDIPEEAYWGLGIGEEALALWVQYLFETLNLQRVGFTTWSGNQKVIRLGNRLGFVEEGRIRRGCVVDEIYYDRIKMGLLKEEWQFKGDYVVKKSVRFKSELSGS